MVNRPDTIILAAGLSSRIKDWKMLLPFMHSTVIETSVNNALSFSARVILVTGHRGDELKELFKNRENIVITKNREFKDGIYSSVQTGVKFVETEYFFITHGDLPLIKHDVYSFLWKHRGPGTIIPLYGEKRGHPVLLPKSIIPKILLENHDSMRELLKSSEVNPIEVDSDSIIRDIDTEADYMKICDLSS